MLIPFPDSLGMEAVTILWDDLKGKKVGEDLPRFSNALWNLGGFALGKTVGKPALPTEEFGCNDDDCDCDLTLEQVDETSKGLIQLRSELKNHGTVMGGMYGASTPEVGAVPIGILLQLIPFALDMLATIREMIANRKKNK